VWERLGACIHHGAWRVKHLEEGELAVDVVEAGLQDDDTSVPVLDLIRERQVLVADPVGDGELSTRHWNTVQCEYMLVNWWYYRNTITKEYTSTCNVQGTHKDFCSTANICYLAKKNWKIWTFTFNAYWVMTNCSFANTVSMFVKW